MEQGRHNVVERAFVGFGQSRSPNPHARCQSGGAFHGEADRTQARGECNDYNRVFFMPCGIMSHRILSYRISTVVTSFIAPIYIMSSHHITLHHKRRTGGVLVLRCVSLLALCAIPLSPRLESAECLLESFRRCCTRCAVVNL